MKKIQSSLTTMVVVLTLFTAGAGLLLGIVNRATEPARLAAEQAKRIAAIQDVMGDFDNDPIAQARQVRIADGSELTVYPAFRGNEFVGVAVESGSSKGFSGDISVMVGIDAAGCVTGYQVLKHAETPGLGAKMGEWFRGVGGRSIIGRDVSSEVLRVSKDGGTVDGITAATITSRAFVDAINRASEAQREFVKSL